MSSLGCLFFCCPHGCRRRTVAVAASATASVCLTVAVTVTAAAVWAGFAREALGVAGSGTGDGARASRHPFPIRQGARRLPRDGGERAVCAVRRGGRGAGLPPRNRSRCADRGSGAVVSVVLVAVLLFWSLLFLPSLVLQLEMFLVM